MREEPQKKYAYAYIDGQNLFYAAKDAFGSSFPDYDPVCLAQKVCAAQGFTLARTHFYTGVPDAAENPFWHTFWTNKLNAVKSLKAEVFSRPLVYRETLVMLPDGTVKSERIGREKGIDVRLALDIVRHARLEVFDVAIIFSQDEDLVEAVKEVKSLSLKQDRWIKVMCAYPSLRNGKRQRGIDETDWFSFDENFYRACVDPTDYRPQQK